MKVSYDPNTVSQFFGAAARNKSAETAPPAGQDPYTTQLSPDEEQKFQAWRNAKGIADDPDYDMRGYYKAQQSGDPDAKQSDFNDHFPDTYKKPSQPTFSIDSKYSGPGHTGGMWEDLGDNKWAFTPGPQNIKNGLDKTRDYLRQNDPTTTLRQPGRSDNVLFDRARRAGLGG